MLGLPCMHSGYMQRIQASVFTHQDHALTLYDVSLEIEVVFASFLCLALCDIVYMLFIIGDCPTSARQALHLLGPQIDFIDFI